MSSDTLDEWTRHFVCKRAPFYIRASDLASLPVVRPLTSRAELVSDYVDLPLDARDTYTVYDVDASAELVRILDSASLLATEHTVRAELLHLQSRLGCGQMCPLHVYEEMTEGDPASGSAKPFIFPTENTPMVSLQYEVWRALCPETRVRWLKWYVKHDDPVCHSSELPEEAWETIEQVCGPMPRRLAGTFSPRSGPNWFSTTLAAATSDIDVGERVAALWLHQGPFLRGLAQLGFRAVGGTSDVQGVPPRSVAVWNDADGQAQHACFVPLEGWALNKDAQGWQAPRQLLRLADVMTAWAEPMLTMRLYLSGDPIL